MKLYTIGFTKTSAKNFFGRLKNAQVRSILDTRANRVSQLSGFAKENDLRFFLSEISSISYRVEESLSPDKDLLKAYRSKEISWGEYARRYKEDLEYNKVEEHFRGNHQGLDQSCLLCSEHEPDFCHRRLAAEYLKDKIPAIEVEHL